MKILKKLKIILPILICLVIPFLIVGCKDKDKEKTYAVTYSYGDAKSLFNNTVKGSDLNDENKLINIPSIKKEYEKAFDGWYVVDSLTKVDEDTPIDSGVKLEPKFFINEYSAPGLYRNGKMVNSWANSFKKYVSADGTIKMIYRDDNIFGVLRKETEYFDVVLDESVKKIDSVFADCKYLKSIVFPNSITSITRGIFSYCSSLENVIVKSNNSTFYSSGNCIIEKATGKLYIGCQNSVIPKNITTIGAFAFCYNTMTNITIPNNITTIENFAFQYCNKLEHITLSNNLTELPSGLFKGCSSLIDITIPKNVKSIDFSDRVTGTFADCTSLERIVVDNNNTVYKSFQNCLLSKDGTILYLAAKNFTLPNTLTEIGKYAFISCPKTLTIPNSVTNICDYAFTKELEVINLPSSLEYIGYGAFEYCENLNSLNISGNSKYETALGSLLKTENGEKQLWIGSNRGEITSDAIVYHNAFRGRKVKYFIIPVKMQVDFIGGFLYEEHKDSKLLYSEEKSCLEKETWYGNNIFKDRTFYFLTVKIQPGDRYVWTYDDKMEDIILVS